MTESVMIFLGTTMFAGFGWLIVTLRGIDRSIGEVRERLTAIETRCKHLCNYEK